MSGTVVLFCAEKTMVSGTVVLFRCAGDERGRVKDQGGKSHGVRYRGSLVVPWFLFWFDGNVIYLGKKPRWVDHVFSRFLYIEFRDIYAKVMDISRMYVSFLSDTGLQYFKFVQCWINAYIDKISLYNVVRRCSR